MQHGSVHMSSSGAKYSIKATDMTEEMQKDAIDTAIEVRRYCEFVMTREHTLTLIYNVECIEVGYRAGHCCKFEKGL